uniref:Uncharacterized protein n=1 Tax=Arion vulgaris TaxID=1028688 RepID=A0A0B6YWD2_9EUPU
MKRFSYGKLAFRGVKLEESQTNWHFCKSKNCCSRAQLRLPRVFTSKLAAQFVSLLAVVGAVP